MSLPGYLLVFSEHGPGVAEEEFHDWYENEHIPLRVQVPAFKTWYRWKAINDGIQGKPTWAASYDLTSFEATSQPPYSTLAETRSDREKGVLRDMDLLERRTYEAYEGNDRLTKPSPLFDPSKPAFIVFSSVDVKPGTEEEYSKWYDEEHIPLISEIPGWLRSRRFILKDWSRGGVEGSKDQTPPPYFLAVHEYAHFDDNFKPEVSAKLATPWSKKIKAEVIARQQLWRFELRRKWERE